MTDNLESPYINIDKFNREQRILEKQNSLELLRAEVADEMIDRLLGEETGELDIVSVERTKLATCFMRGILEYEKRRMKLNLFPQKEETFIP